ncbi:hypothetical protein [Methylocella sp.]|uniref:hypothetical protein n=1 Tax=Methylocella sp. TaxID=1978226 RepID=UPI0037831149
MSAERQRPSEVARRLGARSRTRAAEPPDRRETAGAADGWRRETFTLPRGEARDKAREWFDRFPKAAYMTEIESWRELSDDRIEFTMRRLPSAD